MRITFGMQQMRYDNALSGALSRLMEAQDRVDAKRNLLNPEQSPSNYVGSYTVQRMIDELTQFNANAKNADGWLTEGSNQLENIMKQLAKAKNDLAIAGSNTTADADSRKALAGEVAAIYSAIMAGANTSYMGKYIFGGFQTQTPPFAQDQNSVTGVNSQSGAKVNSKPIFSDLPEFKSGDYIASVKVENGVGKLTITDKNGKPLVLDTNGSDQSGKAGNNTSSELTFEYKAGEVINTGRGVSFTIPQGNNTGFSVNFTYKSGSEVAYNGDVNSILASIGYNQSIPLNMPGSSIFTQSFKTLLSSKLNTVNGVAAGLGALFSRLDNTKVSLGDSIKLSGTDHSGRPIGSATVLAPGNVKLDQTKTTEEERTLNVTYGDKVYKVVIPQASYKTSEEMSKAINDQLQFAEYLGTINMPAAGFDSQLSYQNAVQNQISSGYFNGVTDPKDSSKYTVDLRTQVSVTTDGDRLQFFTSKAGDAVRLAVSGGDTNKLGFQNKTLASLGKDTEFELGTSISANGRIENISNTHTGVDFTTAGVKTFYINGTRVTIDVPAPAITPGAVALTGADLTGTTDYKFTLRGKEITVPRALLAGAGTDAARAEVINKAVDEAGFGGQFRALVAGAAGASTVTFDEQTSPLKKDIELLLDKALNSAGMNNTVGASLQSKQPQPPANLGEFDVTFYSVNTNTNKSSQITSTFVNDALPVVTDMQTDRSSFSNTNTNTPNSTEKTFKDYVAFVQNLYGDAATVSLVDGKIQIKDSRSGESKLTFFETPTNTGVGRANDMASVLGGNYQGSKDDMWSVSVTTTLGANGERNLDVSVRNSQNIVIHTAAVPNYRGGVIELPQGLTYTPDDMGLPDAAGTTVKTSSFNVQLTANTNLNMGDSKTTEDGSNVNIFRALTNLEHALRYNITKYGFSEPTSWKTGPAGSAKPYLDGTYKGTYNDNWNYEVLQNGSKLDYYLQNEFKSSTGTVKYDAGLMARTSTLDFGVNIFDNTTGKASTVSLNIDLSKAFPAVTDAKSTREYIISQLNKDTQLKNEGITFFDNGGKIEMSSNSGSKIASLAQKTATGATGELTTEFTNFILGFDSMPNKKMEFPVTFGAAETFQVSDLFDAPNAVMKNITIPAGTYTNQAEVLTAMNAQLTAQTGGRVAASFGAKGELEFKTAAGALVTSKSANAANPFGILTGTGAFTQSPTAVQAAKADLSAADDVARSLTFKYVDAAGKDQSTTIMLDKKAYASEQEMADAINSKLAAAGVINNQVTARVGSNGLLTFTTTDTTAVRSLAVEGDYAGTLGFPKAGDEVKIRVTSENGGLVQEVTMNVANKTMYIADGLYLGFDKGSLRSSDSFSAAIGSGVENEITALDKAEKQVLRSTTVFGNRGSRIESLLAFQKTIIASNEQIKAGYLGSTEVDLSKAVTDWKLADSAYQSALSVTSKMMSLSLLDFLR